MLLAGIVTLGGVIQLIPYLRSRTRAVHRWNGRLFLIAVSLVSTAGLYMAWVRHSSLNMEAGVGINAMLILIFSGFAWRSARFRSIASHRRWALRARDRKRRVVPACVGLFAVDHPLAGVSRSSPRAEEPLIELRTGPRNLPRIVRPLPR
ncbi:MAG: hypothetical protein JWM95_1491 [Gemmatimonadetes bacterium]|nr:hypothetical protein [Gemmatimonadota bacterium]